MLILDKRARAAATAAGVPTTTTQAAAAPRGLAPVASPVTPEATDTIAMRLMQRDSPMMRQAETRGLQFGNSRGLLNSSITAGAVQGAAYDAALPLASAEASRQMGLYQTQTQVGENALDRAAADRRAAEVRGESALDRAAADKRAAEASVGNWMSLQQNTVANIMANPNLSAEERTKAIEASKSNLAAQMRLTEDLYGIDLAWPGAAAATPARAATPAKAPAKAATPAATPAPAPRPTDKKKLLDYVQAKKRD